ncbi:hypothetical protein PTTG_26518 [Puccinia triticina 1-1 BBBD Race 1]|uniref:Uncharacterized protein n=2 Tax=Puccinia triticina TaxID=208348 RepID=A0A180GUH6_PUCT1|nr:uncharacterized protein PtA15_4A585 [Puccinia triticina]OAV95952.1 hypothetical protein PTTG_26518 [Puccinia triticina 1-1 BBBD Race 1]WAQ84134.1 hypothetical protein PtA15_4A585 [Puccinia triticina]WAR54965.1 hypothetical protein PtB15_4B583 [Puccinia triticina]
MEDNPYLNPTGHQPEQSTLSHQPPSSRQRTWNNNNQQGQHHQPYRSQKKPRVHNPANSHSPRHNAHHPQQQNRGANESWFKNSMLQDPWLPLYNS